MCGFQPVAKCHCRAPPHFVFNNIIAEQATKSKQKAPIFA